MSTFLLITVGSHGDVHPFVGLGQELLRRGHRVKLIANEHFKEMIERSGIEFVQMGTDEWFREGLKQAELWHRTKGTKAVMEFATVPLMRPAHDLIQQHHVPGDTTVIASSLAIGARIARDHLDIKLATVHLSPCIFRSNIEPPILPGLYMPKGMPNFLKDALWWVGDKLVIDPTIGPELNAIRKELGLAPVKRIFRDYWNSPDLVVGLFPDWYGPKQSDWPKQVKLTSFPLWDEKGHHELGGEVEAFLKAGDAPIAFTPGSAMIHGQGFFKTAVEVCQTLGRRGILLTRHGEQIPKDLPASVKHVPYAPFSELLPRCAALVHHGGIGTTAQTILAGIPHLVMPMAHDQPDNAVRLNRMGVAEFVEPKKFTTERVSGVMKGLLESSSVRERTKVYAEKLRRENGIGEAVSMIETLQDTRSRAGSAA